TQERRQKVQMIFQDPYASLNPRWRVADIIAEPMHALKLVSNRREAEDRVADLLRRVRLDPVSMRKYPHEFSGGQRQRIALHVPFRANLNSSSATSRHPRSMSPSRRRCLISCETFKMSSGLPIC